MYIIAENRPIILSPYLYRGGMKYVVKQFHACLEWVG